MYLSLQYNTIPKNVHADFFHKMKVNGDQGLPNSKKDHKHTIKVVQINHSQYFNKSSKVIALCEE